MDQYQELFNKITLEITSKRKEIPILKEKIDKANERYNKLKEEINDIEDIKETKQIELENMPNKNNNKIFYKIFITGLLLTLIPSSIIVFISTKLLIYLNTIETITYILLGTLIGTLGIIIPSITGGLIIRKIFLKKINQSKEKIKLSPEYQNLLKEIETLENNLSIKKSLLKTEEKTINDTKTEYNLGLTEINMKETLIMYLKNENQNKINNTNNEQEETKIPKKIRKKD